MIHGGGGTCIREKKKTHTFHALTFGNGASTNFTAPSDELVVVLPALVGAFESSPEVFALSVFVELALLEVLLSPADTSHAKKKKRKWRKEFIAFILIGASIGVACN